MCLTAPGRRWYERVDAARSGSCQITNRAVVHAQFANACFHTKYKQITVKQTNNNKHTQQTHTSSSVSCRSLKSVWQPTTEPCQAAINQSIAQQLTSAGTCAADLNASVAGDRHNHMDVATAAREEQLERMSATAKKLTKRDYRDSNEAINKQNRE